MDKLKHEQLTSQIIKAYYHVYNRLGPGFLESVYRNALCHTLSKSGIRVDVEFPISVYFDGVIVGQYFADLCVNETVIVEVKAVEQLIRKHDAQLLNYLKATRSEIGLLFNFGCSEPEFRRKILSNDRKQQDNNL